MEIKIGSRWLATGRNLPSEEIKVKMFSTCPSALTGLRYVTTECGRDYNEKFFLNNFTPIEGQTVRDFKVGDTVEVKYQGVISEIDRTDQTCSVDRNFRGLELTESGLQFSELTLLEPAKPKLEVGDEFSLMPGRIRIEYVSEKFVVARYLTGQECEFGKDRKDFERFLDRELITEGE